MDEQQRKQVADHVRGARTSRGWSQKRLAGEAGVAENTVLSIEQAKHEPQPDKLRAVLDALGLAAVQGGSRLELDEIPDDARIYVRVVVKRLAAMTAAQRDRFYAKSYQLLLDTDI